MPMLPVPRAGKGVQALDVSAPADPLAEALDCDEFVPGRGAIGRGNRACDLVAIDLAEGGRPHVVAGLTVGGCNGNAAFGPGCEASVDTVAVGVIGNDEDALFSLRASAEEDGRKTKRAEYGPHRSTPPDPRDRNATQTMRGENLTCP